MKVGDLVVSISWAKPYGVLKIVTIPYYSHGSLSYYKLVDPKTGQFRAYHTDQEIRKLTKLEKALQ